MEYVLRGEDKSCLSTHVIKECRMINLNCVKKLQEGKDIVYRVTKFLIIKTTEIVMIVKACAVRKEKMLWNCHIQTK